MIALIGPRPHDNEATEVALGNVSAFPLGKSPPPTPKTIGESEDLGDGIEGGTGLGMPSPLAASQGPAAL